MKFYKAEIKRFEFHIPLMRKELKTDRHFLAILGTYGFTFTDDINRLKDYCIEKNYLDIVKEINILRGEIK